MRAKAAKVSICHSEQAFSPEHNRMGVEESNKMPSLRAQRGNLQLFSREFILRSSFATENGGPKAPGLACWSLGLLLEMLLLKALILLFFSDILLFSREVR